MEKVVIKQCKLLFILFVGLLSASVASAQSERFLWEVHSPHILSISQRTMDSVGNLYVAGVFESQAEINGQYICPADTDAWLRQVRHCRHNALVPFGEGLERGLWQCLRILHL